MNYGKKAEKNKNKTLTRLFEQFFQEMLFFIFLTPLSSIYTKIFYGNLIVMLLKQTFYFWEKKMKPHKLNQMKTN